MTVVVTFEYRFARTPDGAVWTQTAYGRKFFQAHFLSAFDNVRIVSRVRDVEQLEGDWNRVDGPGITLHGLPYYIGPVAYLRNARKLGRVARAAVGPDDAVILRVPSQIATHLEPLLRNGRPYGVQVVGDPYDVFAPGTIHHPLRPFFRWWFPRILRRQCAHAAAAAYVTERTLQRRYPCPAYSTYFSDVELTGGAIVASPRVPAPGQRAFSLVTVGSLSQLYKAPDVLIDAVAALVKQGLDLRLALVGDGRYRPELEERARSQGLGDRVVFRGQLPSGDAVRAELDRADLFVLPSRTEGLPRAIIEAMARGLPCIGSSVGGIPELLEARDLVPADNVEALASLIKTVVTDPQRMTQMAERNLSKAQEYRDEVLRQRREAYYRHLRDVTEQWVRQRQNSPQSPLAPSPHNPDRAEVAR
jgi:glycosyltransferase involved in cell wall biosynthesis